MKCLEKEGRRRILKAPSHNEAPHLGPGHLFGVAFKNSCLDGMKDCKAPRKQHQVACLRPN